MLLSGEVRPENRTREAEVGEKDNDDNNEVEEEEEVEEVKEEL